MVMMKPKAVDFDKVQERVHAKHKKRVVKCDRCDGEIHECIRCEELVDGYYLGTDGGTCCYRCWNS